MLRTHLKYLGKNVMLAQITNARVAEYVATRRGMVSDLTVNTETKYLRAVLRMAAKRWGYEVADIDWKQHRLKEPDLEDRFLEPEQVDRLIREAAPHLKPIIKFSVYTGVRAANAIQLDWSQIDMPRREIAFKVKSSQHRGGKSHVIPMSEEVFVLLANMGPKDEGPVFTYKGRAIKYVQTAFTNARKRAGITGVRWHDLRHTFGSWLIQGNVELDIVQDLMGHANIETTRRYARRKVEQKRKAVGAIASRWRHSQDTETPETIENRGKAGDGV